ncbi:MAG: MBL fold metallo-hydrolase [Hyphomicrobiales bacterium]|nr:MBL fold metallo-hydrolase [Hyphomicrobiales bacterium]
MPQTRRRFIATSTAAAGMTFVLPFAARAASHSQDEFTTSAGTITVHPVSHASFVMETPAGVIYCDPVGKVEAYAKYPRPDLLLITHHHVDHYKEETLNGLVANKTRIITNPTVFDKLSANLKSRASKIANGASTSSLGINIDAIPAYNFTAGREKFHPKGRDNGYMLNISDFRIYISGDTEDIAEMRALSNIDIAFVSMNLPFTMDVAAAASAIAAVEACVQGNQIVHH